MPKFNRRLFLGGVGAGAMALPFLRATQARAQGAAGKPKRLVVWFTPDGTIRDEWFPTEGATDKDFQLKRILQPLDAYRDKLLLLDNLKLKTWEMSGGPGDGHQRGMGHMLTGAWLLPGGDMGGDTSPPAGLSSGISIDQRIANQIATATNQRKSLELGIQAGGGNATAWNRMSYRGSNDALEPNSDPRDVFNKVFGSGDVNDEAAKKRAAMRKSVLDTVKNDFARIEQRIGRAERQTLERHKEGVLEIERRLGLVGGACTKPVLGADVNVRDNANFPAVGQMQMDIALKALSCDLTRVVSLQWSNSVGNPLMTWVNVNGAPLPNDNQYAQHTLSHIDDQAFAKEALTQINRWYAQQFAYFIGELANTDEPDGSGKLIDNTIVLWVNELGEGRAHNNTRMPYLMAGNVGGHFKTGRYVKTATATQNDLHVSLCNAYGIDTNTFGDPRFCTGAIPGLT